MSKNDLEWLPLRSSHFQRKNYFIFGIQKRLRAFLNPLFTGRTVTGRGSCNIFAPLS
ncbi:hypothetical protein FAEPRAM212_00515 [Faecalibacterium prausnitzii M21/2]|uniref:Uncharacterized protein n=1 Tax=Faecalibacterium prausnitzii M21/2 TaxID=411485 RepID=A8S7M8_9FIRM|nr:hypothetical protein FAEPRAM212_00515 [Faecalibacterium prausnitzii M21/2]